MLSLVAEDASGGLEYNIVGVDFDLPDYTIVSGFVSYDVTDAITVRADVGNLFDDTYQGLALSETLS